MLQRFAEDPWKIPTIEFKYFVVEIAQWCIDSIDRMGDPDVRILTLWWIRQVALLVWLSLKVRRVRALFLPGAAECASEVGHP